MDCVYHVIIKNFLDVKEDLGVKVWVELWKKVDTEDMVVMCRVQESK